MAQIPSATGGGASTFFAPLKHTKPHHVFLLATAIILRMRYDGIITTRAAVVLVAGSGAASLVAPHLIKLLNPPKKLKTDQQSRKDERWYCLDRYIGPISSRYSFWRDAAKSQEDNEVIEEAIYIKFLVDRALKLYATLPKDETYICNNGHARTFIGMFTDSILLPIIKNEERLSGVLDNVAPQALQQHLGAHRYDRLRQEPFFNEFDFKGFDDFRESMTNFHDQIKADVARYKELHPEFE